MKVTAHITVDVDTDRWSNLVDSEGQVASEVRKDIQRDMRKIVLDDYRKSGLLLHEPPETEDVLPEVAGTG